MIIASLNFDIEEGVVQSHLFTTIDGEKHIDEIVLLKKKGNMIQVKKEGINKRNLIGFRVIWGRWYLQVLLNFGIFVFVCKGGSLFLLAQNFRRVIYGWSLIHCVQSDCPDIRSGHP